MSENTVWLLTTSRSLKLIAENPRITIGKVLTLGDGHVLVQVAIDASEPLSESKADKNGQEWYQPTLPGIGRPKI